MGKTEADDTANAHINSAITTAKRLLEALDKWKFATDCDTPVITTGQTQPTVMLLCTRRVCCCMTPCFTAM
jgi:hypothetical protein